MFTSKTIKAIVELLWSHYQPTVVKKVFMPFVIYLWCFMFLNGGVVGDYLKTIENLNTLDP